jgi:hypothetical protein
VQHGGVLESGTVGVNVLAKLEITLSATFGSVRWRA